MKQNGQWLSQVRTRSNTALVELEAERRAVGLVDLDDPLQPAPAQLELDVRAVGLELVRDHVAHRLAVDREHLVADDDARPRGRGSGRDGIDAGSGHEARIRGRPATSLVPCRWTRCSSPNRAASAPASRWRSRRWRGWCGPSSRPCTATTRSCTTGSSSTASASRASCSSTTWTTCPPARRSCCRRTAARPTSSRPPARTAATSSTRCARSSPRCTTRRRSGPARASRSCTSVTPATTRRWARSRSRRRDPARRARRGPRGRRGDVADPERVAVLAQTTLAQNEWAGIVERARERFPDVWTASRNDLCFATTNRQDALTEIANRADAVVVIGSANSSNTIALTKVAREAGCATVLRVDGPDELDLAAIRRRARRRRHRRRERTRGTRRRGDRRNSPRRRRRRRCASPTRTSTSRRRASCAS